MNIEQFQTSFLTCVIVYIWTRTDAFYDYFKHFGFTILKEYGDFKSRAPVPMNFADFLVAKKPGFITKLISCPICLSVYLSLIFYISFFICGLKQVNLFCSIYLSWALFFILEKLNTK